jgi:ABC-2 type transport system ATP-binding protein
MIDVRSVVKRYGDTTAVDDLSFTVQPGVVTGFLGPNGAGKSTTMRMVVALDRPTSGEVLVAGRDHRDSPAPLREVGALLEARAVHPGRSARNALLALAVTHGIPARRVDEVLDLVGLTDVARQRAGSFSLGMGQRLGIAAALLGDPAVVVLDEPVNGLDPDGVRWIRGLLRSLAEEGRTVLVSSHLMSEMAVTAEHLVVIGRGRLIADVSVAEFTARASADRVLVRTSDPARLATVLAADGVEVAGGDGTSLTVRGLSAQRIGDLAFRAGLPVHELTPQSASLEEAFMALTGDAVEHAGRALAAVRTERGAA